MTIGNTRLFQIGALLGLCLWWLPIVTLAATFTTETDPFTPHTISVPDTPQTIFGELAGYPHTYTFSVDTPIDVTYRISTAEKHTLFSLLLVKHVDRGVAEVVRVDGAKAVWSQAYDWRFAKRIAVTELITTTLAPGVYKLEISNPTNEGRYQLDINGGDAFNFFRSLTDTFRVHAFYGSWVTALISWQILVLLVCLSIAYWWLRRVITKSMHA